MSGAIDNLVSAGTAAGLDGGQMGNIAQMQDMMKNGQEFMMAMYQVTNQNTLMTTALKAFGDEANDAVKQRPQV